ncbi:MAG: BatA domain-containing protein [Pirellulaceae bacterium]
MVFLNGWLLALGVAAVSVPIVLHFMARNRPKPTPFPTIRWLSEAIVTNRRRVRLKQWILLALRGAILAWLGLTLAHPSVAAASASMWGQAGLWGLFALAGLGFAIAIMLSRQERSRWWIIGGLGTAILAGLVACVLGLGAWWSSRGTELQGGQGPSPRSSSSTWLPGWNTCSMERLVWSMPRNSPTRCWPNCRKGVARR